MSITICCQNNYFKLDFILDTPKATASFYYENESVFLEPITGIGYKIDFTDPASYMHIDKDELDIYVGLAEEWLNRSIEEVFAENEGFLAVHQEEEFDRLGDKFEKYYIQWEKGEALKSAYY